MKNLVFGILLRRIKFLVPLLVLIAATAAVTDSPMRRINICFTICVIIGVWFAFEFCLKKEYRRVMLLLPCSRKQLALALWGTDAVLMPVVGIIMGCLILPLPYLIPPRNLSHLLFFGEVVFVIALGGACWLAASLLPIQELSENPKAFSPEIISRTLSALALVALPITSNACIEAYGLPRSPGMAEQLLAVLFSFSLVCWITSYWAFRRYQVEPSRWIPASKDKARIQSKTSAPRAQIIFSGWRRPLLRLTLETAGKTLLSLAAMGGAIYFLVVVVTNWTETGKWRFWTMIPLTKEDPESIAFFCFFALILAVSVSLSSDVFGKSFRVYRILPLSRTRAVLWSVAHAALVYLITGGVILTLLGFMAPEPSCLLVPFFSCGAAGIACGMLFGILVTWSGSMFNAATLIVLTAAGPLLIFAGRVLAEPVSKAAQDGSLLCGGVLVTALSVPLLSHMLSCRAKISIGIGSTQR